MGFPKEFCRGVVNYGPSFFVTLTLDKDTSKYIPRLSIFKPFSEPSEPRSDEYLELSIVWYDNDEALNTLFEEKKNGEFLYKAGVCKVKLSVFKTLMKKYSPPKLLSFERQPLPTNEYHGNLLMNKQERTMLHDVTAHLLALRSEHIPNPNVDS